MKLSLPNKIVLAAVTILLCTTIANADKYKFEVCERAENHYGILFKRSTVVQIDPLLKVSRKKTRCRIIRLHQQNWKKVWVM